MIKLLGIQLYNSAMESMNLKDNTHTHMSRNDKQRVWNTREGRLSTHISPMRLKKAYD
jgi:hypothetical protein